MDSRSSLAARRNKLCSSGWRGSSSGAAEGTARHGGSEVDSSSGTACAGAGLAASASAASRAESASWIAESAASVGSVIFFGVFAMSVVASYYAGLQQRQERNPDRATSAFSLEIPSGTPSGPAVTRRTDNSPPFGYPIASAYPTKPPVYAP